MTRPDFVAQEITIGSRTFVARFRDLLPGLSAEQYLKLKVDLRERKALLVPPIVDENGTILDGGHRLQACSELYAEGIKIPLTIDVREGLTEEEKEAFALSVNLCRRHLTSGEWQQAARRLHILGWSTRRIAQETGVPKSTVDDALRSGVQERTPEHVTGQDGKTYPAQREPEQLAARRTEVAQLAEKGESRRAIAKKVGVSVGTVAADLKAASTPAPALAPEPELPAKTLSGVVEFVLDVLREAQEKQDWAAVDAAAKLLRKALVRK